MQLHHIEIGKLRISAVNMRHGRKEPDVSDILPSVRARGILQPLLVRPDGEDYEIVAGRRRYFAAKSVEQERGEIEPLPCAIMEPGDDAAALEASLIENIARLDPDEMSQYETFARLVKSGKSVADIAATFGITERMVNQRLALGNLLPKIKEAYRREEIDAETIRHLTMASKTQQKEWLALFGEGEAPTGYQVKQWLFGGQSIATKVALFPLDDHAGQIVTDLFGEDGYFADTDLFWQKQNEAVAAKRDALLAAGWGAVEVLETGERFNSWEYEKTPKKKGGKVFITVSHRGEVEIHEGWLSHKEARRSRRAGDIDTDSAAVKSERPEVTSSLQTYIDLHRHAAVRTALLDHPGAAFRLMVAHAIAGSSLWQVKPDRHPAMGETIAASLAASPAQAAFEDRREEVRRLLDLPDDHETIAHGNGDAYAAVAVFVRLLALSDDDVFRVLAIVMGETLEAGSALVEAVGVHLQVEMNRTWKPDDAFFDLIRDRAVINAMVAEMAGRQCADGNVAEKVKTQKQVIRDCLAGENGRVKVENWLPGWMAFPVRAYTDNGLKTTEEWARVSHLFENA